MRTHRPLRGQGQLLTYIPYQLRFQPVDSVVLCGFDRRGLLLVVARFDPLDIQAILKGRTSGFAEVEEATTLTRVEDRKFSLLLCLYRRRMSYVIVKINGDATSNIIFLAWIIVIYDAVFT